ncbi:MAG: type II secretion system protein GspE [Alphaproteobacteria bacterium]|nr:type II secretion system protein GspE [Alphaproteobacteria bacterium]
MALSETRAMASDAFLDHLMAEGAIDAQTRERVLRLVGRPGETVLTLLAGLGLIAEEHLALSLAAFHGLPLAAPGDYPPAPVLADRIQPAFLRQHRLVPLADEADGLRLAMADPGDRYALEAVHLLVGKPVRAAVALPADLDRALDRLYGSGRAAIGRILDEIDMPQGAGTALDAERLSDLASEAPVVRLINSLVEEAVATRASDIHIEPFEDRLLVRYRVDGVLRTAQTLSPGLQAAMASRVKILAGLDIAERRLPQDGRCKLAVRGRDIDIRVACLPTQFGESVVLRLLDKARAPLDFALLGFTPAVLAGIHRLLDRPHGVLLVTGPTGSGKTTTLYAALNRLNTPDRKILTAEDPIEYQLAGINQVQVNPRIGLSFSQILRAQLRQDPDILMVGEIRDGETAQIAVQAALTGHLVLSTVHTNSAAGAVTRLLDMGIEGFLLNSTVNAILSQRLVKTLCPQCRQPAPVGAALARTLGLERLGWVPGRTLYKPVGCAACGGTGYRGRTSIAELLVLSDGLAEMVLAHADAPAIERRAIGEGMVSIADDGLSKALAGETTLDEVMRVTTAG